MKPITLLLSLLTLAVTLLTTSSAYALSAEEWFNKGNEYSQKEQWQDAVKAYKKSIEMNSSATVAHMNLGLTYKKLKNYGEAQKSFETAVELEPQNTDARFNLGNIYNFLERWEDAIAQLNIVVHRSQNDAQAHGNLGWAYFNYKGEPPFKILTVVNLEKAIFLFEEQSMKVAADSTRAILEQALGKYKPTPLSK